MPGTLIIERRQNRGSPDSVAINFPFCRETGVKILRHISTAKHANGRRQRRIQRFDPTVSWQKFYNINMRALCERMDPGVGSSGPVHAHGSAGDTLKCALDMILNSVAMRLALPAGERRTVVGDDQFQSLHHGTLVIGDQLPAVISKKLVILSGAKHLCFISSGEIDPKLI